MADELSSSGAVSVICSATIALNRKKYRYLWRRAAVDPKTIFGDRSNAMTSSRYFSLYGKDEL